MALGGRGRARVRCKINLSPTSGGAKDPWQRCGLAARRCAIEG